MTATGRAQGQQNGPNHGAAQQLRTCGAAVLALALGGCSSVPSSLNPVAWWHDLQGGAVAQDRPPAPGATDPYPNLATVPSKPEQSDPKARAQVADALVADRANAQYAAAQAPIPDPSSRAASPQLFGVGTAAPPPPPGAASATLDAASAPPPPPAAIGPTPNGPPPAAPAPTPAAPAPKDAGAPLAPSPQFANNRPVPPEDPASLPPLPAAPPPAPSLPGATPTNPRPAAAPTAPPAKPGAPVAHDPIAVAFPPGSADLANTYRGPLKALADKRGQSDVIVVGYGEATLTDPHAQSVGLSLGLARAQAIAAALAAAGVPADRIQVQAEAAGRGGAVRLVN